MSGITTHVLDTANGRPAVGVGVVLAVREHGAWREIGAGATDADGRLADLTGESISVAEYRLVFNTGQYWAAVGTAAFHPSVTIDFQVEDPAAHHHVPLLLSPFGYTTYRGS